jgi:hypothetical protein
MRWPEAVTAGSGTALGRVQYLSREVKVRPQRAVPRWSPSLHRDSGVVVAVGSSLRHPLGESVV